ncbi:MAG: outer membrane beta-barrel protein [Betaproteobacteria bacterium]|nr:outer membrane beta-barrel protein [Betaproteobacteria bacterium]
MHKLQRRFAVLASGLVTLLGFQAATVVAQEDAAPGAYTQETPSQEGSAQETSAQGEPYKREDDSRNPFTFTISESLYYSSNVYRLPDRISNADAPKGKRSDSYSVTRVGIDFDTEHSRQAFHAGLSASQSLYRTHSSLNTTEWDGRLRWDWRMGNRLSGTIGYAHSGSAVNFEDVYTGSNPSELDGVTRQLGRFRFGADFWWHPNWATGVGFSDVRNDYRNNARPYDKYNAQEASLNFTYRPSTGNRIVLSLLTERGQYSNRPKEEDLAPGETSMRDWKRHDARLSGQWQLTGVTQLSGYAGYTWRKYDLARNRDFNGATGKIEFRWVPTGKAIINLGWRREIGADQDTVSNFAVTQAWFLKPTWVVTSKIHLGASYEHQKRDYRGDPGFGSVALPRDAKTQLYGVNLQYMPVPYGSIALGYQHQKRDTTKRDDDHSARTTWLSGSLTF